MRNHEILRFFNNVVCVILIILGPISLGQISTSDAQSIQGRETGWCTDHSGRNYRCSSPAGSGVGCAQAAREAKVYKAKEDREWATKYNRTGIKDYNAGRYASAATNFQIAVENFNSQSPAIKRNYAKALHQLGREFANRGSPESAAIYFYRSLSVNSDFTKARQALSASDNALAPRYRNKCSLCSKAYLNDIGYGLNSSAQFSNYAAQATNNYVICKRRFGISCEESAGEDLFKLNRQCNALWPTDGEGAYKTCLRRAHSDAVRKFNR